MNLAETAEDQANQMLTFLHLCEEAKHHKLMVDLRRMDGAVPLVGDVRSTKANQIWVAVNDGKPALWPVDFRAVAPSQEVHDWPAGTMQFHRMRTLPRPEARKFGVTRFSPFMLMHEFAAAMPDGTINSSKGPLALLGGKWRNAAPHRITCDDPAGAEAQYDQMAQTQLGFALTCRYEWSVWMGHAEGPRIRFLSDPVGAREAFRLRDLLPGRERRTALRNWVEGHWRRAKPMPEEETEEAKRWIERHLRGATDFTWNGLRCRVQPPEYEVERLQQKAGPA